MTAGTFSRLGLYPDPPSIGCGNLATAREADSTAGIFLAVEPLERFGYLLGEFALDPNSVISHADHAFRTVNGGSEERLGRVITAVLHGISKQILKHSVLACEQKPPLARFCVFQGRQEVSG